MIKLDSFITDINGKVGSTRYRRDQCGFHIEEDCGNTKPRTKWQLINISAFLVSEGLWDTIGQLENLHHMDSWRTYTQNHPKMNKKGEVYFLSAYNAFLSVNMNRILSNQTPTLSPWDPAPIELPVPDALIYAYLPSILRVVLVFDEPMETSSNRTPKPEDFDLYWSPHYHPGVVSSGWINQYQFYINFGIYLIREGNYHLTYRRGDYPFESEDGFWRHSFKILITY